MPFRNLSESLSHRLDQSRSPTAVQRRRLRPSQKAG